MALFHLALASDWAAARAAGQYAVSTRGLSIDQVGFLHGSADRAQVDGVARRFYADVTEPLILLEIDEARLARAGRTVRLEPVDPARPGGSGELFPHVYGGPLPVDAVVSATPYDGAG